VKPSKPCDTSSCGCNAVLPRRDFLKLAGLLAAGAALPRRSAIAGPFAESDFGYSLIPADKKLSAAWLRSLVERGEPTVYRGAELDTIGMPVGGICTGQLYLGGDGRLWHWDIFNAPDPGLVRVVEGPHYRKPMKPCSPLEQGFALKANGQVRRIDKTGFSEVDFCGQYPIGTVNYRDPACPVAVTLEAYSPFIPLNAEDSGLPATLMEFTVKNTSTAAADVELAGWLENAVCKFSPGVVGVRRNRVVRDGGMVRVESTAAGSAPDSSKATREDIVFADFEDGAYGDWQTEGTAFGSFPATLVEVPAYQSPHAMGGHGQGLANSHASAPGSGIGAKDGATGKLISPDFTIERDYIRFLIGGGADAARLGLRLLVDGNIVRSTAGENANKLRADFFDVREFAGRRARLEIVDEADGAWGNIGVDHIVFTDEAMDPVDPSRAPDFGTLTLALLAANPGDLASADVGHADPEAIFAALNRGGETAEKPIPEKLIGAAGRRWTLQPGEEGKAVFVLAWHFPRIEYTVAKLTDSWSAIRDFAQLKRYYAERFRDAAEVAKYLGKEYARLSGETKRWRDTWYDSTLPHWLLDRTLVNISTLATATCHRFSNGRYWFWEGIYCCQGTCTHVWHYAQAVARLFPEIERDLRERVDYGIGFNATTGVIGMRAEYQPGPATDGHAGTILRTLREHQMSPDDAFLKRNWSKIKKAVEWLVAQDEDGDGIITRAQHNTLDEAWYGAISWISSLYVAALKAGAEMAREMGEPATAEQWTALADKGSKKISGELFHRGQYFIQRPDPAHLEKLGSGYGCEIDQVFGQSWAFQVGLDRVLPLDQTRRALDSLWLYNFAPDVGPFRDGTKIPGGRWYALPGDGGLVMCTFPDPEHPKPIGNSEYAGYLNECMTGFEHQVASHMVWEGGDLVVKGLAVARMIHDRYHASRRNPWNEIECGDHYGRAMASYGVFTAACEYEYHGPRQHIGFAPRLNPEDFRCAFTGATGWGTFSQRAEGQEMKAEIAVHWGNLPLGTIALQNDSAASVRVELSGSAIPARLERDRKRVLVKLDNPVDIAAGAKLDVTLA